MNEESKRRYEVLKAKQHRKNREIRMKHNVLLQECLEALNDYTVVKDERLLRQLSDLTSKDLLKKGNVEINKLEKKQNYYIIWDNIDTPVLKCRGEKIIEYWEDISAVAFDTVLVDENLLISFFMK